MAISIRFLNWCWYSIYCQYCMLICTWNQLLIESKSSSCLMTKPFSPQRLKPVRNSFLFSTTTMKMLYDLISQPKHDVVSMLFRSRWAISMTLVYFIFNFKNKAGCPWSDAILVSHCLWFPTIWAFELMLNWRERLLKITLRPPTFLKRLNRIQLHSRLHCAYSKDMNVSSDNRLMQNDLLQCMEKENSWKLPLPTLLCALKTWTSQYAMPYCIKAMETSKSWR